MRDRVESDPEGIAAVCPALAPVVETVAQRQAYYDADEDIYGSFLALQQEVEAVWAKGQAGG